MVFRVSPSPVFFCLLLRQKLDENGTSKEGVVGVAAAAVVQCRFVVLSASFWVSFSLRYSCLSCRCRRRRCSGRRRK